jgi:hypothetical protein
MARVRTGDAPTVFICHASADGEVAAAIVHLLRAALRLSSSRIRCTSVDGSRLPVGVDTAATLRTEILTADVFISILTLTSVRSSYVLFELGARWGAGRFIAPVIARGLRFSQLPAPLDQINALDLADASQVYQLLENVAAELGIHVEPPSALAAFITPVVTIAGAVDAGANEAANAAGMATPMERELLLDLVMKERLSTLADLHMSTERRLAKVLVHHAQKCGSIDGPYWRIKDRVSHAELALLTATTRPRVTAFMQRFRALGIIDHSRDVLRVHREKALQLLLEG